jgi:hypothetical protein
MGRSLLPDERLYRETVADIRLRDRFEHVGQQLREQGFKVSSAVNVNEIEQGPMGQLIAFRPRADVAVQGPLRPDEMLTIAFCYGRVQSLQVTTPLTNDEVVQRQSVEGADRPHLRVQSVTDQRETRSYSTNRLSGDRIRGGAKRRIGCFSRREISPRSIRRARRLRWEN